MQTRRLRMTAESSVGRESLTCVSRELQLGQRIRRDLYTSMIRKSAKRFSEEIMLKKTIRTFY
jgi:hypothetical protein